MGFFLYHNIVQVVFIMFRLVVVTTLWKYVKSLNVNFMVCFVFKYISISLILTSQFVLKTWICHKYMLSDQTHSKKFSAKFSADFIMFTKEILHGKSCYVLRCVEPFKHSLRHWDLINISKVRNSLVYSHCKKYGVSCYAFL